MSNEVFLLVLGWVLGLVSSLLTGLMMFWLEGKRAVREESARQRHEDIRTARNWAHDEKKSSMRGFDLVGANLSGKKLIGADLEDTDFREAKMWETDLKGANLIKANFQGATLNRVNFEKANLHSADFTDATLIACDFNQAKLRKTKFLRARKIERCVWLSAAIDDTTELNEALRQEIQTQNSKV